MKTLRVCHSKDLPSIHDRDINYIYFLYDKLEVFLGQNYYSDPYAIVESYPFDNVIPGMLYFCLDDGYVKAQVNLVDTKIAKIESDEQLEILKQAGTTFFVNAERRYLDVRTRCISLPFRNGSYELTVNLAADLKINKNTVIAFNPETQQFEIVGDIQDFDIVFSRDYRGLKTDSVDTKVEDHKISSDVKISDAYDNIIKETPKGLYASVNDRVTSTAFENWIGRFQEYKEDMEAYIEELSDLIERAEEIISTDSIIRKINECLTAVYPEIDDALENYDEYSEKIDSLDEEIIAYADDKFDNAVETLEEQIINATNNPWEDFEHIIPPEPEDDFEPEPDEESSDDEVELDIDESLDNDEESDD